MRIYLKISQPNKLLELNYQQKMLGVIHKWLGKNKEHDSISLYSMSWLSGGKLEQGGLNFPNGGEFFISAFSGDFCERIITGARKNPNLFDGMRVEEIIIGNRQEFYEKEYFYLASPVLIRKKNEDKVEHLTWDNPETDKRLVEVMQWKMEKAGLNGNINIKFDREYSKAKTKLVTINEIKNRANMCPVIIEGDPDLIRFAYDVGIGESTGSGFGALR